MSEKIKFTDWRRVRKNWCIIQHGAIIREYESEYIARLEAAKIPNCKVEYIER